MAHLSNGWSPVLFPLTILDTTRFCKKINNYICIIVYPALQYLTFTYDEGRVIIIFFERSMQVTALSAASWNTLVSRFTICLPDSNRFLDALHLNGSIPNSSTDTPPLFRRLGDLDFLEGRGRGGTTKSLLPPFVVTTLLTGIFLSGNKSTPVSPRSEDSDNRNLPLKYFNTSWVPRWRISRRIPRIGFPSKVKAFSEGSNAKSSGNLFYE